MNALLIAHVGGGLVAILTGAIAIPPRKGGSMHALAGTAAETSTASIGPALRTE